MTTFRRLMKRFALSTRRAVTETPVEVLLGLVGAGLFSATIESVGDEEVVIVWAMTALLAWLVVFSASALHRLGVMDTRQRWFLTGAYVAGCAALGGFLLDVNVLAEVWRYVLLLGAGVVGITLVPVAAASKNVDVSQRFWRFNVRLIFHTFTALLWAGAMFAGLAAALGAVNVLFDLNIDGDWFAHLFSVVVLGGGSALVAGGLPHVTRLEEAVSEQAERWIARVGASLFIPLMLLYLAIIYVYIGKLVLTGDAPSNLLSPLALGAGALGYAGLFVLEPVCRRLEWRRIARTISGFPLAFIPVVPLAAWAILTRVGQYGWTEFRYVRLLAVACLGIITVVTAVHFLRGKRVTLNLAPAVIAGATFVASFGPWGVVEVSKVSQLERLEEHAKAMGMLGADGTLQPSPNVVDNETASSFRDVLRYLEDHHGDETLAPYLPVEMEELRGRALANSLLGSSGTSTHDSAYFDAARDAVPAGDADLVLPLEVNSWSPSHVGSYTLRTGRSDDGPRLEISLDSKTLYADFSDILKRRDIDSADHRHHLQEDERYVSIHRPGDQVPRGKIAIERLNFRRENGKWELNHLRGLLLLKTEP